MTDTTFAVCITRDARRWQRRVAAFAQTTNTRETTWSCGDYSIFVTSTLAGGDPATNHGRWQLDFAHTGDGNAGLTISIDARASDTQPELRLQRGLLSTCAAYWWRSDDDDMNTLVCCNQLSQLARLIAPIAPIALNEDAVPHHMVFRRTCGDATYLRGIYKLPPGCTGVLRGGQWHVAQVETFDALRPAHLASNEDSAVEQVEQSLIASVQGRATGNAQPTMLLSGGVDSTLIASLLKACLPGEPRLNSMSYNMTIAEFAREVDYARMASDQVGTRHEFVPVAPDDYLRLLCQTTDMLGQPISEEQMPCYTALAETKSLSGQRLFSGEGGDNLLGLAESRRYVQAERYGRIPGSHVVLALAGRLLAGVWPTKAHGMREIAEMVCGARQSVGSADHPAHLYGYTDTALAAQCFGDGIIERLIGVRLAQMQASVGSAAAQLELVEFIHLFDLVNDCHPSESVLRELLGRHGLNLATPLFDGRVVSAIFALPPSQRYFAHSQYKWIGKELLARRSHAAIATLPKQHGGFRDTLFGWMKDGLLRDRVRAMPRPSFMPAPAFAQKLAAPDWFTWNLLTLDVFREWTDGVNGK